MRLFLPVCPVTLVRVEAEVSVPGRASSSPSHPDAGPLKIQFSLFAFYLFVRLSDVQAWRVPLHFP